MGELHMRISKHRITLFLAFLLTVALLISAGCSSQPPVNKSETGNSQSNTNSSDSKEPLTQPTSTPSKEGDSSTVLSGSVTVVVAGYINHGPLQPTVRAIKEVITKYGDKLSVSWVDLETKQGESYFKEKGLTAHMNVIINGTSKYQVDGRTVDFQWFEGQQWNKKDLDSVLSNLTSQKL
jgi:hypothetical protein